MSIVGLEDVIPKIYNQGIARSQLPNTTIAKAKRFMPVMGITRIANITHLDSIGIPVVTVVRPNSRSVAVSQGKGYQLEDAIASGLMEAIEGYHAENITLSLKLASYEELRYMENLVHIEDLPFIKNTNFHRDLRILWGNGYDLMHEESVWIPFEMIHTDYRLPPPSGSGCFPCNSNGLASGNHILEAIVHAINEVVERDATALWSLSPETYHASRRVDLATVTTPVCRTILDKFAANGIEVAVWDMTSDIQLPTFMCSIVDRDLNLMRPLYASSGMGTHLTRDIALIRAMTEAAQSRLTVISGARDDVFRSQYQHYSRPEIISHFLDTIQSVTPTRDFALTPTWEFATVNEDLQKQLELLQGVGVDRVIVVDLTKPYFQIPVARVIIPKLEGIAEIEGYSAGQRAIRYHQQFQ